MRIILSISFLLLASLAQAKGERSGVFDYYVMSLSWSPNWCALEGEQKGSPQCEEGYGWVLHGLWPQYHRGWPSFCPTIHRHPSRSLTENMSDIMGTSGLAWYQWKKHGVCSGLPAQRYYELSRRAFESVERPPVFRKLQNPVKLPASVVEEAFLQSNPQLKGDMITITCKAGHIQEARICLDKDLTPISCGPDVIHDCRMKDALFEPID